MGGEKRIPRRVQQHQCCSWGAKTRAPAPSVGTPLHQPSRARLPQLPNTRWGWRVERETFHCSQSILREQMAWPRAEPEDFTAWLSQGLESASRAGAEERQCRAQPARLPAPARGCWQRGSHDRSVFSRAQPGCLLTRQQLQGWRQPGALRGCCRAAQVSMQERRSWQAEPGAGLNR